MKTSQIIPTTITAIAILTTGAYAGSDSKKMSDHSSMSGQTSELEMHRVTQESLDSQLTAKDLIGAAVHDSSGERLGTVADIGLSSLSGDLKKQHRDQMKSEDKDYASKDSMKKDSKKDSWSKTDKMGHSSEVTAYISVGGLFGIGDDIVAVPASKISWNESEEQYTLNVSKDQFVALAEQDTMDAAEDEMYSAKQSFEQDADMVRNAFQSGATQMDFSRVQVETKDDQIVLSGTVKDEETKKQAETLAGQHSEMDIENKIKVRSY